MWGWGNERIIVGELVECVSESENVSERVTEPVTERVRGSESEWDTLPLSTWIYPDQIRTAKITPIFKTGQQSNVSKYSRISVIPCV